MHPDFDGLGLSQAQEQALHAAGIHNKASLALCFTAAAAGPRQGVERILGLSAAEGVALGVKLGALVAAPAQGTQTRKYGLRPRPAKDT